MMRFEGGGVKGISDKGWLVWQFGKGSGARLIAVSFI